MLQGLRSLGKWELCVSFFSGSSVFFFFSMASKSKTITGLFQSHKRLRATETLPLGVDSSTHVACLPSSDMSNKHFFANLTNGTRKGHSVFHHNSVYQLKVPSNRDVNKGLDVSVGLNLRKRSKPAIQCGESYPTPGSVEGSQLDDVPAYVFEEECQEPCSLCDDQGGDASRSQLDDVPAYVFEEECQQPCWSCDDQGRDASAKDLKKTELNQEQKIRMEMNRAAARAKRNLRLCEDTVAQARAQGIPFPKLENLLVEQTWLEAFKGELQKPYMERLCQYVSQEAAGRTPIYPPPAKVFNAFNVCPFDKVKVVIIGQDPYHGPGQAMGLCFSVEKGIKPPSSLVNIFKEIHNDLGCSVPLHGNLEKWAHQGVLLLNSVLTVREHHANSHSKKGWEPFTDAAIRAISQQRSGVVFLLWGNSAQEKIRLINTNSHHILKAAHPSGLSAHRGFFNCRHFSQANEILEKEGLLPIDWQI